MDRSRANEKVCAQKLQTIKFEIRYTMELTYPSYHAQVFSSEEEEEAYQWQ
jgi:hypothetical protein